MDTIRNHKLNFFNINIYFIIKYHYVFFIIIYLYQIIISFIL
jgi:hypothetical protein